MRFVLNSPLLMTWLELTIKFGTGLVLLPLATIYLSSDELAFYLFIGTLLGMAYLAEGGFNKVVLRAMAYFNNGLSAIPSTLQQHDNIGRGLEPNYARLGTLVQTSFYLFFVLGLVAGGLLYFVGGLVAHNILYKQPNIEQAETALLFISIFSFLYIVQLRYVSFIQGINYLVKQKRVEVLFGLVRLCLLAISIVAGFGVLGITIGLCLSVIFSLIWYRRIWAKLGPVKEIKCFQRFEASMLLELYPAAWRQAAIAWGSYLIYSGTTLLVAQLDDVDLIASYLLTLQVVFLLMTVSTSAAQASYPEISKAIAEKDINSYKRLLIRTLKISLAVYGAGALVIVFMANPVLGLIGSNTHIITGSLLYFVLIMYLLELHHVIHATFYTATNHIPFVFPALISGVLILGGGYMVIRTYGIWGAVLVQFFVQLSVNNWYPVWLNYKMMKS